MEKYLSLLLSSKKIALFSHISPDPDTIGSTLALKLMLESLGKKVSIYCGGDIGENFNLFSETKLYNKDKLSGFDLFVSVDMATASMLGVYKDEFLAFGNTLKLDHHTIGDDFAGENVTKFYSAMAIFVFEIAEELNINISSDIATKLFFAIVGDTGNFKYNNTDSKTLLVASKLLEFGADINFINKNFFDKMTIPHIRLASKALLNAEVDEKNQYAILVANKKDYEKFGAEEIDNISNLPNYYLSAGVKIAVIIKDKSDGVHCSFRSVEGVDSSAIASKFGGGGHKCAAGCTIKKSVGEVKKLIKGMFEEIFKQ